MLSACVFCSNSIFQELHNVTAKIGQHRTGQQKGMAGRFIATWTINLTWKP